jgi:hypothetical protein
MYSPCEPPKFVEEDFEQFDFSRWHLDGLTLNAAAETFAGLSEKLFNSEEWRQNFKSTLPEFSQRALDLFKEHSRDLQEQRKAAVDDFNNRATAAEQRSDAFRKSMEAATAPAVIEPTADAFHVSVKVVSEKAGLGLSGVKVQVVHPKDQKTALAESFTDRDGNAVVTVPPELAKELDKRDTALQVVDPAGKVVATLTNAVCIRVGQTETRVVKVGDSPALAESQKLAQDLKTERDETARRLAGRSAVLKQDLKNVIEVLDCRLRDNDAIIAELEKPQTTDSTLEATEGTEPSPKAKTSEKTPPSGSEKGRKKPK